MTPEQAFEHFQNYAKEHGVQIYALDTTDETKKLVEALVNKGGHSVYKQKYGTSTPFVSDKCLVLCSVPHSFDNCNKNKTHVNKKVNDTLVRVKEKLHSRLDGLSEHVPILTIGFSNTAVERIAKNFKSNPILHLGRDNTQKRSILRSSSNDGIQQSVAIVNYHHTIETYGQPNLQYVDPNGEFHDINKPLTIPNSPSHRLSVDHEQAMGASAGAAPGTGSVDFLGFTNPQHPQGAQVLEDGTFCGVSSLAALQVMTDAMMPLGDYVPPNSPGSFDGGADVPEVEKGSLHQEPPGKKPEPRRPPI